MHFSIIIPTFNRVDLLRQALPTALGQTGFDDFEVIASDDCSDDGTWPYLQSIRCERLRIRRNDHGLGMTGNWKNAIEASRGRFIYVLQDDDLALPNLLSTSAALFDRHQSVELVCFATCLIDEGGQNREMYWQPERETLVRAPQALLQFASHWTLSSSQVVFARSVYDRHAGFDQTTPILSDADGILRWMIDADVLLHPDPLALRRRWAGSATARTQHSPAMLDTMKFLVANVMHCAVASKALSAAELVRLETALASSFLG